MRTSNLCLLTVAISCAACGNGPAPPALDALVDDESALSFYPHPPHCFRRIDLGTLGGATSDDVAINRRGEIVGNSDTAGGESHAYLWRRGVMIDLGTLGGARSSPTALDDLGRVVGYSQTALGLWHAFRWQGGVMTDLTPDAFSAVANDINDQGWIVGTSRPDTFIFDSRAFLWLNGATIDLGVPGAGATEINERGDILGSGFYVGDFLWRAGIVTPFPSASLNAIDERGRIVGYSLPVPIRAFVWQDGVTTDLGTLGGTQSTAEASNGHEIVGWAETPSSQQHAVVWTPSGIRDLNALGGGDTVATGINRRGDIVGNTLQGSPTHAFFWSDGDTIDLGETIDGVVLNDAGQVAGTVPVGANAYHAVLWQPRCCSDEPAATVAEAASFSSDE
jgi:probable HAF family extracellular repeat protein